MASSGEDISNDDDDMHPAAAGMADGVHLLGFSDEILLHILSHVPSTDLILNVRRTCRKLAALCLDKSLIHTVLLQKDYQASEDKVRQLVKEIGREIQQLSMAGCYWLPGSTVEHVARCRSLVKVNLSGCHLTSLRLSKMLSALQHLRSLAIDVSPGFDASQLSSECKATLSRVRELKQTLFTPSYGVVPCCTSLEKLLLYFEILDRTREGAILSGQLMVGQSNVPHYQNLRVFYARLAPGYINQEVVRLYLAVLSDRTPQNLHAFLISVPGSFAESGATKNLLDSMARNVALDALQLPKSWLNGSSLLQHMKFNNPFYFSFSRCTLSGGHLIQQVINGGKDLRSLASLNLSGCVHCLSPDSLLRKAEDDIDSSILETLVASCCNLRHLNLSAAHHHSSEGLGRHLCQLLARLRHLRSLSLPVCSVADSAPRADRAPAQPAMHAVPRGFGKKVRVGVQSCPSPFSGQAGPQPSSVFWSLLKNLPFLEHLELIGSNFSSAMPRNEPAIRNSLPPCSRAQSVGDSEVAAIGQLAFLRHLTLAQLPSVLTGSGLVSIGLQCQQLRSLSLANLGMMGKVVYMPALSDMLKHCKRLRDLRLEQPYFSANAQFFQALSQCPSLQRLCLVSRSGTLQPDAVLAFMTRCLHVVMCHLFTGESLATCKSLQQSLLRSFQAERPALNVIIFPLLHEGLTDVIRDVPLVHLDEITLFKSRVAEEPPNLWW
ncbi:F-box/LRR-repeat protein 18 isoform X1 [Pongo pygmaeus]|uniref:F-box and leucine rich repeat protein 18 n=1 Tax=Pongo abelii TaxID=9601 RepID=H2PLE5_PONAB|nr:F-box/LRR-repeat protein 18 isoform X2 [Pongo abelii]XP_054352057.1 F-box/LRR-repeat protein 18 isoform X2 [Pongo pygmaeus]PNJ05537.1 FBXL18 isoform 3 [Pongo abelii]